LVGSVHAWDTLAGKQAEAFGILGQLWERVTDKHMAFLFVLYMVVANLVSFVFHFLLSGRAYHGESSLILFVWGRVSLVLLRCCCRLVILVLALGGDTEGGGGGERQSGLYQSNLFAGHI
jgi:hypothetical protein